MTTAGFWVCRRLHLLAPFFPESPRFLCRTSARRRRERGRGEQGDAITTPATSGHHEWACYPWMATTPPPRLSVVSGAFSEAQVRGPGSSGA